MSDLLNGSVSGNEQAVETTIVGGRPAGHGQGVGDIPHGIEVLIKKASVDASFRHVLLENHSKAVLDIGLDLTMAEFAILVATTPSQFKAIIENTKVPDAQRSAFLGRDVNMMRAAIAANCECLACRRIKGHDFEDNFDRLAVTKGIQPDIPPSDQTTRGIRPDFPPPATLGIRPDPPIPDPTPTSEDPPLD